MKKDQKSPESDFRGMDEMDGMDRYQKLPKGEVREAGGTPAPQCTTPERDFRGMDEDIIDANKARDAAEILDALVAQGNGAIVSSGQLDPDSVRRAWESGRMFVREDGLGFVLLPQDVDLVMMFENYEAGL